MWLSDDRGSDMDHETMVVSGMPLFPAGQVCMRFNFCYMLWWEVLIENTFTRSENEHR